jgi:membrane-associated protease RseP (regulator of RpoE activity)
MNLDLITFFIFVLLMSIFLYVKRKNIVVQKLLFPLFYLIMYRTSFGLKLMDKMSKKYRELIKLIGYTCVGLSFLGMIYISYGVIMVMVKFFMAPATTETGFTLVLPGTSIPGIGYLSFWYWIIPIVILAIVHEFSHGVMTRAHNVKVKSSGFAFLGILAPIVPAAFVEPDEKELSKQEDIVQYSVFAAGPISNIILAFLILLIFPYVADMTDSRPAPFEDKITYPAGFSVDILNDSLPSGKAGMSGHLLIDKYDNKTVLDANLFVRELSCKKPGDVIYLGNNENNYEIKTTAHPDDPNKAFVGVYNMKNERKVKPEFSEVKVPYYWLRGLFRWLFLLNYFIGLINLFPIFITDGARILRVAMIRTIKNKVRAAKLWSFVNMLFLFLLLVGIAATYLKKIGLY